jgi:hypothetical protein
MISVLTGDIVHSRLYKNPEKWLKPLKAVLSLYGKTPRAWEVFRGDSFQLEIPEPKEALLAALRIKAAIRTVKGLDVRIAIGIGEKEHQGKRIAESNGPAFLFSGETYETLKKRKQQLAIQTPWPGIDRELNLLFSLASIATDRWTTGSAEIMLLSLQQPPLSQKELGEKLGRTQSSISERQARAHMDELRELEAYFREKITLQTT